jgi:hypothetical protein
MVVTWQIWLSGSGGGGGSGREVTLAMVVEWQSIGGCVAEWRWIWRW